MSRAGALGERVLLTLEYLDPLPSLEISMNLSDLFISTTILWESRVSKVSRL